MFRLLLRWAVAAAAVAITAEVLPGVEVEGGVGAVFLVAAVLGIVSAVAGSVLRLLTFPLILLTLGLFLLVVNALMLLLTDALLDSLAVDGFWWALVGGALISVLTTVGEALVGARKR